ncbi:uncharacterized protein LOC114530778 [Dendronephthya gigantea]|uniref:uncharacterized protein LOC114530778 n=1 Tax=Dendronephthya gigantea TaxID=151771 RepID=UPI00106B8AB4|nr:uncharacterized protein LOC114530778 [Dendronephthya gigantea]
MTVHLFGAASSPSCANFALKTTANDNEKALGSAAADFLRKDFYVDDGLKSVQSVDEAVNLIKNTKEMCSRGGFNLHKFVSNNKDVVRSIPECYRADAVNEIDLDLDSLPIERALGIQWCAESDSFQFPIVLEAKPCTRRGILSTVSSIFDPIRFVDPLLLEGKSILQALCRQSIGWDDAVPDEAKSRWEEWKLDLVRMKGFSIPRCYKPLDFGRVVRTELHHFSDASVVGYGQCSYLRFIDECDLIHCAFVMGKSRVAPLKSVTIPRLELTAAVCSVRVSVQLRHELDLEIDQEIFWTDSKVVLGYIANETRRFHIFVANRVQEIQDHTSVDQWRYVESKSNPADEASRGVKAKEISESKWLSGPSFLWKPEEQWPSNNQENQHIRELSSSDPEVKKAVVCSTSRVDSDENSTGSLIEDRLLYFSDWYRGKRAIALCLRYVRKLRARVQRKKSEALTLPELTVSELSAAEKLIIRSAQATAFSEVLTALKKDTAANRDVNVNAKKGTNTLRKLDPYLDEEGILRVGGRLRRANLSEKIKHPIILPRKGHVMLGMPLEAMLNQHNHNYSLTFNNKE